MVYQTPFISVTWGGTLFQNEIWANGIHLGEEGQTVDQLENLMTSVFTPGRIADLIRETHISPDGPNVNAILEWVKFALIDTDGQYIGNAVVIDVVEAPGGFSGEASPNVSAAISWKSGIRRGPASNGRIYPPANATVGTDGFITEAKQESLASEYVSMLDQINGRLDLDGFTDVRVALVSKVGTGMEQIVTSVRVGNILDVQRRRRNQLTETYVGEPLTFP